jgi:EXS family
MISQELGTGTQKLVHEYVQQERSFGRRRRLELLITETEQLYSMVLCDGRRTEAMDALRLPQPRPMEDVVFSLGLILGITFAFAGIIAYMFGTLSSDDRDYLGLQAHNGNVRAFLVVYRTMIMSVILGVLWGADVYIWEKFRINYVFIFEVGVVLWRCWYPFCQLTFRASSIHASTFDGRICFRVRQCSYLSGPGLCCCFC